MEIARLLETLLFAAEAHKDQRRKGENGAPYVNHLIEVASLLSNIAKVTDIHILQAAVLHDALEDTAISEHELAAKYASPVVKYVKYVTDDNRLSLAERRIKQVQTVTHAGDAVKLIKLADHCSNVASLPANWPIPRCLEKPLE